MLWRRLDGELDGLWSVYFETQLVLGITFLSFMILDICLSINFSLSLTKNGRMLIGR
jgi:hypothetical protein